MMVICIKQHLSNIWSSIHEKTKQRWGWVVKTRCLFQQYYSLFLGWLLITKTQYREIRKHNILITQT